ncbi:endonuclease domain-containing protein [Microbacterium sp. OR16]|uniref:endonuclease domain-containing protein n=1 Tax=Microbacterium sp. OR16 TaxID=3095345 RepID=UPI0039B4801D
MHHRKTLPAALGVHFALRDATAAGVGKWRASAPDLARPFNGVRAPAEPETFLQNVACYRPRMRPHHRLVGRSAMRVWGIPHPDPWQPKTEKKPREPIEIAVPRNATPPRTAGVAGRRLTEDRASTWTVRGVRTVDPVAALITTAHELSLEAAVIAIDAIITRSLNYPGLEPGRPRVTRSEIAIRVDCWGWFTGRDTVRTALALARDGVESPKETETRLMLVRHGLPEPHVQHDVFDGHRRIARVDLAYPEAKIAIEYEGDGHRTSQEQWRRDIQRQRELEALGWIVMRLTQVDLDDPDALITRVRSALASRR